MHILWLVRTTLPQAAAACGLAGASDVSGSWLTGQLAALRACPDLHLTVLCVGKADADGTAGRVHYRVVRDTAAFAPLLQAERPDLVHIWGTEFDPAAVMADAARASGLPVLFSVQGVMRDCAAHLCDGVPEKYRRSGALWHTIDKIISGELLDNMQASFDALAAKEAAALADARYVTGRTAFDRAGPPRPLLPLQRDITSAVLYGYAVACAGLCRRAGAAAAPGQLPAEKPAHRHQGAACRAGRVR